MTEQPKASQNLQTADAKIPEYSEKNHIDFLIKMAEIDSKQGIDGVKFLQEALHIISDQYQDNPELCIHKYRAIVHNMMEIYNLLDMADDSHPLENTAEQANQNNTSDDRFIYSSGSLIELEGEDYEELRRFVMNAGQVSVSQIQKHFRTGYNHTSSLLRYMVLKGYISQNQIEFEVDISNPIIKPERGPRGAVKLDILVEKSKKSVPQKIKEFLEKLR